MVISTGTVEITFAADDPRAIFRCKLDKAQFVNCEFYTYLNVGSASYHLVILSSFLFHQWPHPVNSVY